MDASVSVEDKITLLMYLPEVSWITLICIPRAKLGELYLTPVKWLRYFASNAYGADGEIYSRGYTDEDADEDENMTDEDADKEEVMTDVQSEEEEEPAIIKNHGESKEEPVLPKVPVDQTTILISAQLEEIPAICYFCQNASPECIYEDHILRRSYRCTAITGSRNDSRPDVGRKFPESGISSPLQG
jgi:hypothetical protein